MRRGCAWGCFLWTGAGWPTLRCSKGGKTVLWEVAAERLEAAVASDQHGSR
jgi:hypothetical protein